VLLPSLPDNFVIAFLALAVRWRRQKAPAPAHASRIYSTRKLGFRL